MFVFSIKKINVYFSSSLNTDLKKRYLIIFEFSQSLLCQIEPIWFNCVYVVITYCHNNSFEAYLLSKYLSSHDHKAFDDILKSKASKHLYVVWISWQ